MAKFCRFALLLMGATLVLPADAAPKRKATPKPTAVAAARKKPATPQPATPDPREFHLLKDGELPLKARGAIVLDALTGQTLYEKNAEAPQFPASTTKIMTALLVIEEGDLEKEVEIVQEDSDVGESSLSVKPGDRFTRRQMLYGLMLKSANDVAHSLGRDNAGTMPLFAEKMTRRAHELGATRTNFMNPHGLHHVAHFTTPRDLALITRAAMQQPLFRRIVSTQKHPWVTVTGVPIRELFNHNKLLTRFEGCTGVKTGFTRPAMNVLASAALRGNREVIAAVMHSDRPGQWEDSMQLLSYGLENEAALKKLNSSQPP